MADASGLTAAQAEANQIPYKNIALGNPAETFLNAWALSTGLKLKQQEFEGKMQALQLKNSQMEADSAMKDKINEMRLMTMQQGMGMKEAALGLREGKLQLDTDIFNTKVGERKAMQSSVSGISRDLAQITDPLAPDFMAKVEDTLGNPDYQNAPPSFITNARNNKARLQQNAVINARNAIQEKAKALQHDISSTVWGNPQNTDLTPIKNPDQYPDVPGQLTPEQQAGLTWQQKMGFADKPAPPPTGLKQIQQYVNGKAVGKPRQVPAQYLTESAKKYQELQDQITRLPPMYKGAYSTQPLPASKQALQSGVVYDTDAGDKRWTGTGFVDP